MSQKPLENSRSRRYTDQEREQAVRLVRQLRRELGTSPDTIRRVAEQLGYGTESVRGLVKQVDIDGGEQPGTTTAEAERVKALEQENRNCAEPTKSSGGRRLADTSNEGGHEVRFYTIEEHTSYEPDRAMHVDNAGEILGKAQRAAGTAS